MNESAPEAPAVESAPTGGEGAPEGGATPHIGAEVMDLGSVQKFKFEGREWTPDELKKSVLRNEDYTRKTQEIGEERRYFDNLQSDLDAVRKNPSLESKFRDVYPEKFHRYLEYVRGQNSTQAQGHQPEGEQKLDPQLLSRFEGLERMVTEDKVQALEAKLEAQDSVMSQKFPLADIEAVYARAQAEHSKGTKLSESKWEEIWKTDHERHTKRYETHYTGQIKKQRDASAKAKDMAPGGGIPGQAPARVKLRDVAESIISGAGG